MIRAGSRPVAFVDLDGTVLHTRLRADERDSQVCARVVDPVAGSRMTSEAMRLLAEIGKLMDVVPTTTRSRAQFERLDPALTARPHAIVSNGATILKDGVPDRAWDDVIRTRMAAECAPMEHVRAEIEHATAASWPARARVVGVEDRFFVVVLAAGQHFSCANSVLTEAMAGSGWYVSGEGRKRYVIPDPVRKDEAAREVARRLGASMTLAAGDSELDESLLAWAEASIYVHGSELDRRQNLSTGTVATSVDGLAAGEEVLRWLLRAVAGTDPRC